MLTVNRLAIAAAAALGLATAAHGQDTTRWFVHAGPAEVALETKASMTAGGQPVPGAAVSVPNQWTAEVEVGYFATPNIAIALAGGLPPTATVNASGSLAALGRAGQMTYGPSTLNAQYHANRGGMIQPYIGVGPTFMLVFGTKDGALTNLKVNDAIGWDVQAGADVMFNAHWGAFIDAKKAFLSTKASGMLGPAPVSATVQLNPAVFNAGVTYRF